MAGLAMIENIALWLGSGLLSYIIWAFVMRGEGDFPFKTEKFSHLLFLIIFLASGWFGLAYWGLNFIRPSDRQKTSFADDLRAARAQGSWKKSFRKKCFQIF